MRRFLYSAFFVLIIVFLYLIYPGSDKPATTNIMETDAAAQQGAGYDFYNNGKDRRASELHQLYNPFSLDSLPLPIIDHDLVSALEYQLKSLQLRKPTKAREVGNVRVSKEQLEGVIEQLLSWQHTQPLGLSEVLEAHQIWGEDQRGNVHFTGYFTPVIKVSNQPTQSYAYPIYTRPKNWKGIYPTRAEIEGKGALKGRGLEIAYAQHPLDVYFMQIQGSGYVEFLNGDRKLFAYDGTNKHPYRSIGRFMVDNKIIDAESISMTQIRRYLDQNPAMQDSILFINPSYTFFTAQQSEPRGAGLVPLTTDHSIAVDPSYIPLGSCLLGKVPVVNEKGHFLYHEYRFLVAQDVGGAIKGPGHIDLYSGTGIEGRKKASYLHHYGKLWLLLPKKISPSI